MRPLLPIRTQSGFSLLALAIWMTGLGLAVVLVLALLPNRGDQERIEKTIATIGDAQDAVLGFVVENYRLPCPDTSPVPNGLEGMGGVPPCTAADETGALPYRSMGLPTAALDQAGLQLRYTPYKNQPVDLTVASESYSPTLPDLSGLSAPGVASFVDPVTAVSLGIAGVAIAATSPSPPTLNLCANQITPSPVNLLDFCTALESAIAASTPPVATSVNTGPAPNENVAYAILSGGLEDADGDGADGSLDGLNDSGGSVSYEDPAKGRGSGYDDIVRATRFSTLQRELSCQPLLDSVNLLASVAESGKAVMDNALQSWGNAEVQAIMATVAVLMDIVGIAMNLQSVAGIAADIAKTAGGCASIILSVNCCPALAINIAGAVVYAVTIGVQVAILVAKVVVLVDAITTRNLFRSDVVPRANENLCAAIAEATAADARGGLALTPLALPWSP